MVFLEQPSPGCPFVSLRVTRGYYRCLHPGGKPETAANAERCGDSHQRLIVAQKDERID